MICGYSAPILPGEYEEFMKYPPTCPICHTWLSILGRGDDTATFENCRKNHRLELLIDDQEVTAYVCRDCGYVYHFCDDGMWMLSDVDRTTGKRVAHHIPDSVFSE